MDLFEFLLVLISVVIGLGLAELLSGAASLLRSRNSVRFYWIHVLFQVGIFFALLQQWWESWNLQGAGQFTFTAVLVLLAPSVFLFLIAHLLFPLPSDREVDLEEYYYSQSPLLWGLVIVGTLQGTFVHPLVFGYPVLHPANISGIPMTVLCIFLAGSKNRRLHAVLGPIVMVMVVLDTVLANPAISTG